MIGLRFERPDLCTCNHMEDVHRHYTGIWCSKCECGRFRRAILLIIRRRLPGD